MAMKRLTKEERGRQQRRLRRQILGAVFCCLALVGVISIVTYGIRAAGKLFDNSAEYEQYRKLLSPVVMLNPVPFDSLETADQDALIEIAIVETLYTEDTSTYSHDDVGRMLLPTVDVDKNAALLYGKNYALQHHTFSIGGMEFVYDETTKSYTIPITSFTGGYTAKVAKITSSISEKRVTVGYIPSVTNFSLNGATASATEPAFYYDYVFSRQNDGYYLTAITQSAMKPASSSSRAASGSSSGVSSLSISSSVSASSSGASASASSNG